MIRNNSRSLTQIERLVDNLLVIGCFILAYYGRESLLYWDNLYNLNLPFAGPTAAPLQSYLIVLLISLPLFNLFMGIGGAYDDARYRSAIRTLRLSLVSALLVFVALGAALYLLKIDLSRLVLGLFCLLVGLSVSLSRFIIRSMFRFVRWRERHVRNILLAGLGRSATNIMNEIRKRPELGIRLLGLVIPSQSRDHSQCKSQFSCPDNLPVYLGFNQVKDRLKDLAIDEIIFTDVREYIAEVEEMLLICAEEGVRTTIAADLFSAGLVRSEISYFAGYPLIHYHTPAGSHWELALKRAFDICVASIMLIVLAPLLLLISLIVYLCSPGPVLFKQDRVGLNGRIFSMYKFRSMRVGAHREIERLKSFNEMDGPVFKMQNDPRIFPFGGFLRRFSLDELPQLWNVLRGDMSLVGPRPPIPTEVHQYTRRYKRRLSMRPGLTCTWQVSGRNNIKDFDSWMKLDLDYIDNWSLVRDISILLRTIPAVLFGAGAR